jgi:MerR family transcriptional regulator, redox-sensitive transcriptional activator SoxR
MKKTEPVTPATMLWTIGQLAARSGVPASALRFYEREALIQSVRSEGGQRRYTRDTLRRVAFIRAAQALGISLMQVGASLQTLPQARTPTKADWARLAGSWTPALDARIAALQNMRNQLTSCIGCGCLSLRACTLYNPQDALASNGPGAAKLKQYSEQ